jgi:hypothetical protein
VAVAIYIAMLVLAFELLTLPLGYYAGYVREHAFSLSTQTRMAWVLDRAKAALILLAVAVPLGSLLALLWRRYPGHWVLPAWALAGFATILLVALAPVVIDPLFHTIQPLRDPDLRQRLIALAERAGVPVDQVYEMAPAAGPGRGTPTSPDWDTASESSSTIRSSHRAAPRRRNWCWPTRSATGSGPTSGRESA